MNPGTFRSEGTCEQLVAPLEEKLKSLNPQFTLDLVLGYVVLHDLQHNSINI